MKYRALGKTGLEVSITGLGTHQFSGESAKKFTGSEMREILERAHPVGN